MSDGTWGGMNWIRKEKRLAIYLRDGMACSYCGVGIEEEDTILTLDHIMPRCKGGDNEACNLVTSCLRCNSARQARPLATFCRAVAEYVDHPVAEIEGRIRNARRRCLPLDEAKELLARRTWHDIVGK